MQNDIDPNSPRTSGALPRGISVLESLVGNRSGLALTEIVDATGISKAAVHRALADLIALGYVTQDAESLRYALSLKLFSVAFQHVESIDIVAVARPVIERLAAQTGELVRLSLVDGDRLVCVAKAQGSTRGLRYDDDLGAEANLFTTATGVAWLAGIDETEAIAKVERQGLMGRSYGPGAPADLEGYRRWLSVVRGDGFARVKDSNELGIAGIAAPVMLGGMPAGVLTIVGPSLRLTDEMMQDHLPALQEACAELSGLHVAAYPGSIADLAPVRNVETGARR